MHIKIQLKRVSSLSMQFCLLVIRIFHKYKDKWLYQHHAWECKQKQIYSGKSKRNETDEF